MIKFIAERTDLLKSLSHVQNVVERRQTIPVLSNVLIEATSENGGNLSFKATDNEPFHGCSSHLRHLLSNAQQRTGQILLL